jgi:hypothetical protein
VFYKFLLLVAFGLSGSPMGIKKASISTDFFWSGRQDMNVLDIQLVM